MPGSYAHDTCARRMLALLPRQEAERLHGERALLAMGAQGPDVFFYHKTAPLKTKGHYRLFAKILHTERIDCVFRHLLAGIKEAEAGPFGAKVFAYFAGYLCHYALDCAAHPYVFNRAGFGPAHTRFEADMDVALLKLQNRDPKQAYPALFAMPREEDRVAVGVLLARALHGCFGEEAPPAAHVAEAIHDMYFAQKLIFDPHGWKRGAVRALEKLLRADDVFTAAIPPKRPDFALDSLNLARRPWREPWKNGAVSDERFVELLERAAVNAADMVRGTAAFLRGDMGENEALLRIGARSFHTGRDYREDLAFEEIGTVWKRAQPEVPRRFRLPDRG